MYLSIYISMHSFEVHVWYPNILAPCTYLHMIAFSYSVLMHTSHWSYTLQWKYCKWHKCMCKWYAFSQSFFNAMLCSLVHEYLHFEGTCCLNLHANSKNSQCVHWISNIIIQYWNMIYCVCSTSSVATDSTTFSWEWVNKFTFWVNSPKYWIF